MVDWSKIGRHAQYGNGLKRAKYRGWLYPVVVVVGSLLVHLLQDDRRRSLAKTNIVVYVFGSILHVIPWETPRAYVLALAADFCAITGVYTTHVRAYCRSTAPASTLSLWMTTTLIIVQFVSLLRKRDLQYDQMNRAVRVLCGFGQNFLLAAVEVLRIPAPLGWGVALSKVLLFLYFFVGGRAYAASFLCRLHAIRVCSMASARWRAGDAMSARWTSTPSTRHPLDSPVNTRRPRLKVQVDLRHGPGRLGGPRQRPRFGLVDPPGPGLRRRLGKAGGVRVLLMLSFLGIICLLACDDGGKETFGGASRRREPKTRVLLCYRQLLCAAAAAGERPRRSCASI